MHRKEQGQSLVEVLVAIGVIIVILSSLTIAVLSSLSATNFSRNQSEATQYAQQGIELARKVRNSDYATFDSLAGKDYCVAKACTTIGTGSGCSSLAPCAKNIDNIFARDISFTKNLPKCQLQGATGIEVKSTLAWDDGKCGGTLCRKVSVVSCMTNINTVPTP